MMPKQIIGIVAAAIGALLFFTSFYFQSEGNEIRRQIAPAQEIVSSGANRAPCSEYSKEACKGIKPIDQKIRESNARADRYDNIATWFQIGSAVSIVGGALLIFLNKKTI